MGASLHGTFPIVLHLPAPKHDLPLVVDSLQFKPDIESIHGSAREEVPNGSGSRDDVNAHRITTPHHGRRFVERRHNLGWWRTECASPCTKGFRLFSDRKRAR